MAPNAHRNNSDDASICSIIAKVFRACDSGVGQDIVHAGMKTRDVSTFSSALIDYSLEIQRTTVHQEATPPEREGVTSARGA